jgi:hypothetical protein
MKFLREPFIDNVDTIYMDMTYIFDFTQRFYIPRPNDRITFNVLMRRLECNQLLEKFMINTMCDNYHDWKTNFLSLDLSSFLDSVSGAFEWGRTPEGFDTWYKFVGNYLLYQGVD